jgi:ATP phosphoribosyltransferase regulatory subunit
MLLTQKNGLLPDRVSDLLPRDGLVFNTIRHHALSYMQTCGYELVYPPMLEYLDSFLKKRCDDLQDISLKVTESVGNQTLAIRADITPQIARIDTHVLQTNGVARFCYAGDVFRANHAFDALDVFQIGAEIFGTVDLSADIEIVELACESLSNVMVHFDLPAKWVIDITHSGFLFSLLKNLEGALKQNVVMALKNKDSVLLTQLLQESNPTLLHVLNKMASCDSLHEMKTNISQNAAQFLQINPLFYEEYFTHIEVFIAGLIRLDLDIKVDLLNVSGFDYHSGITWSLWLTDFASPIARGGRYDGIGSVFGRSRPATGFSFDAKCLAKYVSSNAKIEKKRAILAPQSNDPVLKMYVKKLRKEGQVVVNQLADNEPEASLYVFDQSLVECDGRWVVIDCDDR